MSCETRVISIGDDTARLRVKLLFDAWLRHFRERFVAIPTPAVRLSFALAASAYVGAQSTRLVFPPMPDPTLLLFALGALDAYCRFASESVFARTVPVVFYGVMFLVATSLIGVFASYTTQRLGMPLQDELFLAADRMLGVDWLSFVHWVDDHALLAGILRRAYASMAFQILLPVFVLGFLKRTDELRAYVLAFPISLATTIVIAALLPASSAITLVDANAFHELSFGGRTPLDHLTRLREVGPVSLDREGVGGLLSFPSFHAVVAVLTPLSLRSLRPVFCALCVVDAAMLVGTVTEGGHYVIDPIGGAVVAICSYQMARRIVRGEAETSGPPLHASEDARGFRLRLLGSGLDVAGQRSR